MTHLGGVWLEPDEVIAKDRASYLKIEDIGLRVAHITDWVRKSRVLAFKSQDRREGVILDLVWDAMNI